MNKVAEFKEFFVMGLRDKDNIKYKVLTYLKIRTINDPLPIDKIQQMILPSTSVPKLLEEWSDNLGKSVQLPIPIMGNPHCAYDITPFLDQTEIQLCNYANDVREAAASAARVTASKDRIAALENYASKPVWALDK